MQILLEKGLSFSLVYIFRWKVHFFLSQKAQRMVKTSKFVLQRQKNWRQTVKTISCLKIYNNKFSHALLFWSKCMHRNYCFRCKQHSYAACDAPLSASINLMTNKLPKRLNKWYVEWYKMRVTSAIRTASYFLWVTSCILTRLKSRVKIKCASWKSKAQVENLKCGFWKLEVRTPI